MWKFFCPRLHTLKQADTAAHDSPLGHVGWRWAIVLLSISTGLPPLTSAQSKLIDKVVAQVDDRIILWSEIEQAYLQFGDAGDEQQAGPLKCRILEQMIIEKLLVRQAELDSIVVSDQQVEQELELRIRYFASMIGSIEKLEEYYGKSVFEIKEEFRDQIKERQLADRQRSVILEGVKVTPSEVYQYFQSIPTDSLPFYNAEVEVGQVIVYAKVNDQVKEYARQRIEELRRRLLQGEDFATLARAYSKDPGSAEQGGDLGFVSRGELDPAFESAAFSLRTPMEISEVVETRYGLHLIQLLERRGDRRRIRHLLIKPEITSFDIARASRRADSIYALLRTGAITFEQAVHRFSEDELTRNNGGMLINPSTQTSTFELAELAALDPLLVTATDTLTSGQFSAPIVYRSPQGEPGFRILYLKKRTQPHQANLHDDYDRIQQIVLSRKQQKVLEEWVEERMTSVHLYVSPLFQQCSKINLWTRPKQP